MKTLLLAALMSLLTLTAQASEPVKFSDALFQKFQHPRCLSCHQFSSRRSNGRAYGSHRSRWLCDSCHTTRVTTLGRGVWMAPPGESMDYTGLSPRNTCLLIKRNSGAMNAEANLLKHLLTDERVRWALEVGMTPAGRFPAVPGGYDEWQDEVRAWARDGMRCE
jgi:hypothetical protein